MSAPDRIYIHTGDCDDTYYELSDCCDDEVDYIRTDIHEAEITALKAEIAALKAPPKVLSAEEVVEPGIYIVRDIDRGNMLSARHIDCVDIDIGVNLGYEYIGPLRLPEEV